MQNDESTQLVVSPFLESYRKGREWIVYNSLFGRPALLSDPCFRLLSKFKTPKSWAELGRSFEITDSSKWFRFFIRNHMLIASGHNERQEIERMVNRTVSKIVKGGDIVSLGLILDERCNFDCTYCMSLKMLDASQRTAPGEYRMKWEVAKGAVDTFMAFMAKQNRKEVEIYFGGSEPLLNWEVMKGVVEYCKSEYGSDHSFTFATNSNLSLVDEDKSRFLGENKFIVTSSLDGPQDVNDKTRRLAGGGGTYNQILTGWDVISLHSNKLEWFILTLTDLNINEIDEGFFDFLKERGITACSFESDLINPLCASPEETVAALLKFKGWAKKRDIHLSGMWEKPFLNMYEDKIKKRMFDCSAFVGRGVSVSPSGFLLPCTYSSTKLGHISHLEDLFASDGYRSLISSRAIGNIPECQGCEIEGQCLGGCYITTEYGNHTNTDRAFLYRCDVYKQVTRALLTESFNEA